MNAYPMDINHGFEAMEGFGSFPLELGICPLEFGYWILII
jgi:hypothetical protein